MRMPLRPARFHQGRNEFVCAGLEGPGKGPLGAGAGGGSGTREDPWAPGGASGVLVVQLSRLDSNQ
ncbi:hypothetical protein [Streptomyces sp. AN091965]|uniref:hypothetical protein n=1 Tax=Streptomyces sp. AN091965 TaxID=2927803 RepID=UPI001F60CC6F|nr:hypothetical protein [Streptomyces sp. AN091965]MCI3930531.1 hypothetical protein [Streptomyces sp. AN091965]